MRQHCDILCNTLLKYTTMRYTGRGIRILINLFKHLVNKNMHVKLYVSSYYITEVEEFLQKNGEWDIHNNMISINIRVCLYVNLNFRPIQLPNLVKIYLVLHADKAWPSEGVVPV